MSILLQYAIFLGISTIFLFIILRMCFFMFVKKEDPKNAIIIKFEPNAWAKKEKEREYFEKSRGLS